LTAHSVAPYFASHIPDGPIGGDDMINDFETDMSAHLACLGTRHIA